MSAGHTPGHEAGPWSVDEIDRSDWHILGPSNGFCANVIATVHSTDLAEGAANARLIAAAPELLEALYKLWAQAAQSPDLIRTEWGQEALSDSVAVLIKVGALPARARGETPKGEK